MMRIRVVLTILIVSILVVVLWPLINERSEEERVLQETVTIRFYQGYRDELGRWDKTIQAFERTHPRIKVEVVPLIDNSSDSAEAMKRLDALAATGEAMDAVLISNTSNYAKRAGIGMLEPLNSFMEQEGLDYSAEYRVDTGIDGVYYALPGQYIQGMTILNQNHLDEADLPVPKDWTWDDYLEYARKMTKGKGIYKRYGSYFPTHELFDLALINQPADNSLIREDGVSNIDHPGIRRSLEIRHQSEVVDETSMSYANNLFQKVQDRQQFFREAASMNITGSGIIVEAGGTATYPASFPAVFAPFPKNDADDPAGYAPISADFLGIAANSKHKAEAYAFIRWYSTEGMVLQGSFIPSWRKTNLDKIVDGIISSAREPQRIDKKSLMYVLRQAREGKLNISKPYQSEVEQAYNEEAELMLLGEQDIDLTLRKAKNRIDKIIQTNRQLLRE